MFSCDPPGLRGILNNPPLFAVPGSGGGTGILVPAMYSYGGGDKATNGGLYYLKYDLRLNESSKYCQDYLKTGMISYLFLNPPPEPESYPDCHFQDFLRCE